MFNVMIVDDEYDIRHGLETIVDWNSLGFAVTGCAANGMEALEMYDVQKPELVITDIRMPGMDGMMLIQGLKIRNPFIKIIILSGYHDFCYAKEAIKLDVYDYLLKPVIIEELLSVLTRIKNDLDMRLISVRKEKEKLGYIKEIYLLRLVRGENIDGIDELSCTTQLNLSTGAFCIFLIEMDDYGQMMVSLKEEDISLKKMKIRNILEEYLEDFHDAFIFENAENQFGILIVDNGDSHFKKSLRDMAEEMVNRVYSFACERIIIGMGEVVHNKLVIKRSYKSALRMLERKFFMPHKNVFVNEENDAVQEVWKIDWDSRALVEAITTGSSKHINEEINGIFKKLEKSYASFTAIQAFLINILIDISRIIEERKGDLKAVFANEFSSIEDIFHNTDILKAQQLILDISLKASSFAVLGRQNSEKSMEEILLYIDQHYQEDINLKKISEKFYITSYYLGQLFKRKKGEYFNNYLNRVRIEKAVQLLQDSNLPINEISEKTGYKYIDHFYKNFKSITGVNPGEYRKKNNNSLFFK